MNKTDKDREEARRAFDEWVNGPFDMDAMALYHFSREYKGSERRSLARAFYAGWSSRAEARAAAEQVIADYRRLTKELDDALNGDCAARSPSLCDIVAQVRKIGPLSRIKAEARREMVEKAVHWLEEDGEDGGPSDLRAAMLADHPPDAGKEIARAEDVDTVRSAIAQAHWDPERARDALAALDRIIGRPL